MSGSNGLTPQESRLRPALSKSLERNKSPACPRTGEKTGVPKHALEDMEQTLCLGSTSVELQYFIFKQIPGWVGKMGLKTWVLKLS